MVAVSETQVQAPTPATPRGVRPGDRMSPEEWLELLVWDGFLDPDGEDRWEVIDGILVVSTQPDDLHAYAAHGLGMALQAQVPNGLVVFSSPYGFVVPRKHGLGPDGGVKRLTDLRSRTAVPLLIFEVVSPWSRTRDFVDKRRAYAEAGVPSYWIADPYGPTLTVLELGERGDYVEVVTLIGDDSAVIDRPFPVRLSPADLVPPA